MEWLYDPLSRTYERGYNCKIFRYKDLRKIFKKHLNKLNVIIIILQTM